MSKTFHELDVIRVSIDPETRRRHLATIASAIESTRRGRGRLKLLALAVAVVFVLPVLALAAQNAVPGDLLYPVRQIIPWVEPARPSLSDPNVATVDRPVFVDIPDREPDAVDPDISTDRDEAVTTDHPTRETTPEHPRRDRTDETTGTTVAKRDGATTTVDGFRRSPDRP